jgi:hypothetical protein
MKWVKNLFSVRAGTKSIYKTCGCLRNRLHAAFSCAP